MMNLLKYSVPALLASSVMACSSAGLSGKSDKSSAKTADLGAPADSGNEASAGNPDGAGSISSNTGSQPIGSGTGNCPPANAGATAADSSGVGATFSSDNTGTQPCSADGGTSAISTLAGDPATTKVVGGLPGQGTTLTKSQQDALTSCLKLWGFHSPFLPTRTRPDKVIFGNLEVGPANRLIDTVLGTQFSGITDDEVTTKPSLILIIAAVNLAATHFILPEVTYKFHNPKGWYCVDFGLDIASSTKVELKKGAQLADSRFNLSILSSSPATASHQVSILSHTDIVTIP